MKRALRSMFVSVLVLALPGCSLLSGPTCSGGNITVTFSNISGASIDSSTFSPTRISSFMSSAGWDASYSICNKDSGDSSQRWFGINVPQGLQVATYPIGQGSSSPCISYAQGSQSSSIGWSAMSGTLTVSAVNNGTATFQITGAKMAPLSACYNDAVMYGSAGAGSFSIDATGTITPNNEGL